MVTTVELRDTFFKSIERLQGLMYRLNDEATRGVDDGNSGARIALHLSSIFLATSDAMSINAKLTQREQREVIGGD